MSCLDIPRLHFSGQFSTNVCTSNNDDITAVSEKYKPVVDPFNVTLNKNILAMSNEDIAVFFQSLTPDKTQLNGGWNHFGDHVIEFIDTSVSRVVDRLGGPSVTGSKLQDAAVSLVNSPKMVDVDPTGSANTQLFLGGFQLGDFQNGIYSSNPTGMISYDRWIGLRNVSHSVTGFTTFAATWQFGIPNGDSLKFFGDDPTLAKMQDKAGAARGLLVQFCIYLVKPRYSVDQLAGLFAKGNYVQNPAIGQMVGTVGVWGDDDLATFPNGRQLSATNESQQKGINSAAMAVDTDAGYASLNLVTAFPETMTSSGGTQPAPRTAPAQDAMSPEKVSFGTVTLAAIPSGSDTPVTLGTVQGYDDYASYRACSGIVDVGLDAEALKSVDLSTVDLALVSDKDGILLREQPLVVASDDHSAYLSSDNPQKTIDMQVRQRGALFTGKLTAQAGISASSYPWNHFDPPANAARMSVVAGGQTIDVPLGTGSSSAFDVPDGKVTAQLTAIDMGVTLTFGYALTDASSGDVAPSSVGVRIYPDETFADPPTWDEVYNSVLRYYAMVFPAMNQRIDLTDESVVRTNASKILVSLDQPFTSPYYMPVTRSMSPARRKLLSDWLKGAAGV